jgi:hypothetical protein
MKLVKTTVAAATLVLGIAASASAMPVQKKLGTEMTGAEVDQVRLVCNRWGRCWHTYGWRRGYYSYGYHPGWRYHRWHRWHRRW